MEPQVVKLFLAELEHKVFREPLQVPFDRLHKNPRFNSVKLCQVGIEHHLLLTDEQNSFLNLFARDQSLIIYHIRTN